MTRCLILSAGKGSRLFPYTKKKPKALLSFLGKTLLDYQIETLNSVGIVDIGIATGYGHNEFKEKKYLTFYNKDYASSNMVYSLFNSYDFFKNINEDLLISYGDIVYEKKNLLKLLQTEGDFVLMVDDNWLKLWSLRNTNPLNDAETLIINKFGQIVEIGKKPSSLDKIHSQYTGLIKISKSKLQEFKNFYDHLFLSKKFNEIELKNIFMTEYIQLLIDYGWQVLPAHVYNGWLEFDTVDDLVLYEELHIKKKLKHLWHHNI